MALHPHASTAVPCVCPLSIKQGTTNAPSLLYLAWLPGAWGLAGQSFAQAECKGLVGYGLRGADGSGSHPSISGV